MSLTMKPLFRLGITFAIVWFYLGLTGAFLDGWVRVIVTVVLGIPTWIVVSRRVFPVDDSDPRWSEE